MYSQISFNEYQKFKIKQDFELRDFEELSLFLIGLENDDIDYYKIKDREFSIKFWGKKRPDFLKVTPDDMESYVWFPTPAGVIDFDDTNRLLEDIMNGLTEDIMNEQEARRNANNLQLPFPRIQTETTSTTTTQPISTSTTTTTTVNVITNEDNRISFPNLTKRKKEKCFNPIQIQMYIHKIPDEYFIIYIRTNREYSDNFVYFKADQIDGLIEFIKFTFNVAEVMPIRKVSERIEEFMDSIING